MNTHYDNFLKALSKRFTNKSELTRALMDILPLERESIYRRLRQDVMFTPEEIMKTAGAMDISLDNIVSRADGKQRPFRLNMINYTNPDEYDYNILERYNGLFELAARDPATELMEIGRAIPGMIYSAYENLSRFLTMKWHYKYGDPEHNTPLSEIHVTERMRGIEKKFVEFARNLPNIYAIYDRRFIEYMIDEIAYFHSIRMITADELLVLKGELLELMECMEEISLKGYLPQTGSKFFFYLSYTCLEAEYSLLGSKHLTLSVIKALERNGIASFDKHVFEKFKNMVRATMRLSVLMSSSNRLELIRFFDNHKRMAESI